MPALFLQIVTIVADLIIFLFVGFYLKTLQHDRNVLDEREKELAKKEQDIESKYHQVIDNALLKERKIIEDATKEAGTIITNAQYVSDTSRTLIDKALQTMIADIQKEAESASGNSLSIYKNYLNQLSGKSLDNFQSITKNFETEMQEEMKNFRESILPNLQKELDTYKEERFKEADKEIITIIQKVSQKALNKTISLEDHQDLIIKSLEESRKANIFG